MIRVLFICWAATSAFKNSLKNKAFSGVQNEENVIYTQVTPYKYAI